MADTERLLMLRLRPALRGPAALLALLLGPIWVIPALAVDVTPPSPPARPSPVVELARDGRLRADRSRPVGEPVFVASDGERVSTGRIRAFLAAKRSPLRHHAAEIVAAGLRWGVDPRVVVAIAGLESDFGRVRFGYNAWGWGVPRIRYASWSNAIARFTKAFSLHYPSMRNADFASAAHRYAPDGAASWVRKASAYFNAI